MVGIAPGTLWLPAGYTGLHDRQPRKAAILHTNGGPSANGSLATFWRGRAASGSHVGAHYQVTFDGRIECYVNPALVVYHAYSASEFAIGIETEDDGDNQNRWTGAQIGSIAKILAYHQVPAQMLTSPSPGDGVGYHSQFAEWNKSGHDCTGSARTSQIPTVLTVLRGLTQPAPPPATGDDDVLTIMCSPGKHNPRLLPGGAGGDKIGAVMGQADWTAYNELARAGGAKIVVMETQSSYDQVVSDLS